MPRCWTPQSQRHRARRRRRSGSGAVIVEHFIEHARHVEVQLVTDAAGAVVALGDRDCTVQRRHQKLIETAPAILPDDLRDRLHAAAIAIGTACPAQGLATVEFLIDGADFWFIEVNPRLQVEHTVTEAVTGVDLVQAQLRLADGASLAEVGPSAPIAPRGVAIQCRVLAETIAADGARPSSGTLTAYEPATGPGVRVDGAGFAGWAPNPRYDPLLAKVIVHGADGKQARRRMRRALADFRIEGVATNRALLDGVLAAPAFAAGAIDTGWFERALPELLGHIPLASRYPDAARAPANPAPSVGSVPPGQVATPAPMNAVLVSIDVAIGDTVRAGATIGHVEALKMHHAVLAAASGVVRAVLATPGASLHEGAPLVLIEPGEVADDIGTDADDIDLDHIRPDLAEARARIALGMDATRPEAVAKRRRTGHRTARENLDDLFDADSFNEYGALAIAAQRRRRSVEDLMANTPADGLVAGTGTVNADAFGAEAARCLGLAYDYTVLAGTQGHFNHRKTDRLLALAESAKLPIVFYTEGGGGRPGDVDSPGVSALDTPSFRGLAALSGVAPRIGITAGRCFAGNAVFFGCMDVTIATRDANIGMSGPAMIEGGGLGVFRPEDIGPAAEQYAIGVVDVLADDEADATATAKALLGIFQGRLIRHDCADQRLLRHVVPENRVRVYDIRRAIDLIADTGSFVELRGGWAKGMITGFFRLEGRAVGLIANDTKYLSGAIDSEGADKAARFLQLCDAFGVPIVSLCDTPGFMVGPESERTGPVRHGSRMFVVAASLSVPVFTVVLRKGYGLGAQAMAAGSFHASAFTIAWPTGEFGGMGLEGAVRLGFRKELEALDDPAAGEAKFQERVAASYARGKAVSVAQYLEIDAVIDPADTRRWLSRGMATFAGKRGGRFVDCW